MLIGSSFYGYEKHVGVFVTTTWLLKQTYQKEVRHPGLASEPLQLCFNAPLYGADRGKAKPLSNISLHSPTSSDYRVPRFTASYWEGIIISVFHKLNNLLSCFMNDHPMHTQVTWPQVVSGDNFSFIHTVKLVYTAAHMLLFWPYGKWIAPV